MALTDDQKAMLRLLAQREQGYDDIAALTGESVDGVRAKVKAAVAALEGDAAPAGDQRAILRLLAQREEGYADIAALTGQDVAGVRSKVAAALAALDDDAEAPAPAAKVEPEVERPEPEVERPEPEVERPGPADAKPEVEKPEAKPGAGKPEPAGSAKPGPARLASRKDAGSRLGLPKDRGAVWGLGAGLAVVLVLVILLATGALGGGGGESGSSGAEAETGASGGGTASKNGLKATQAVLKPVDGSNAHGLALFGRNKKQILLLVRVKGLEPAPEGQSYTLSLSKSPDERLPLVATQINKKGELIGTFPVAPQVLGLLASGFDEMELSLVADGALSAALTAAKQAKAAPNYSGTDIVRGRVTGAIVEAGKQGKVEP